MTTQPWPTMKLADVLDIENSAIVPKSGVLYCYLGLEHIEKQTGRIIEAPETDGSSIQSQKYVFNPTHVLYGKLRPNLNKVAIPDFLGVCSTDILPLAVRGNLLREYVAFFLRSSEFVHHAVKQATGTKMPRFGPRQFLQAAIPMPPLPIQERIVQILQKAAEIRRKRQKALELADAILPSIFNDMFGNPDSNPKGYVKTTVGKVTNLVTSGYTPRGGARNYIDAEAANEQWIVAQVEMKERMPRLLLLALIHETVVREGRKATLLLTALMKYAFLVQMEGKSRRRLYHFVPYHYGPFAREVYADLQRLREEGIVRVKGPGGWGEVNERKPFPGIPQAGEDPPSIVKMAEDAEGSQRVQISLDSFEDAGKALADLPEDLKEEVSAILEAYGGMDHNQLLRTVYEKYPVYARKSRIRRLHDKIQKRGIE